MTPDTTQALIEEVKRRAGELKALKPEHPMSVTEYIARTANEAVPLADLALRLARVVECLDGALERYEHEIPSNRLITEDSAKYEREYGLGRKARQAREQARKIACGEE